MKIRFALLLVMVGFSATVGSCSRSLNALNPCTINGVVQNVPVNPQRALDLLIVIDDSPSMEQEQAKLAEQVPRLVNLLRTGGAADPNVEDFPPIESLHVGIITPDLGYSTDPPTTYTPDENLEENDFDPSPSCVTNNGNGKAGFMQVEGLIDDDDNAGTPRVMCTAQTPPEGTLYLNYPEPPPFDATDLITDVECVTGQTAGCGFEQQLEAILASDRNTANGGFSRDGALLAVILITDEDDCSTTDPRVFDTKPRTSNPYQGPFTSTGLVQYNLRCWEHKEALQEIERYVSGIASLKDDPSQVVFAAITGIPEDPTLDRENFSSDEERYQAILEHPDMEEVPDPAEEDEQDQQVRPACAATDGVSGSAAPGVRVVETALGLAQGNTGVGTVVESICADDYAPALDAIVDRIAAALRQLCLPRPLNRNAQDLVGCEVREVQPEGQTCETAGRGREPTPVATEDGREVCRITQLPSDPAAGVPEGLGWFYDDFTPETVAACAFNPDQQRVSFTEGAEPVTGARIRFECLQAAPPQTQDIGWPCAPETETSCDPDPANCLSDESVAECEQRLLQERYDRDNLDLTCDPATNTCQLTCDSNVQCPGGFACYDEDEDGESYCVNPTCTLN